MILLKGNYYRLRSRAKIKIDNPELTYCVGLFFLFWKGLFTKKNPFQSRPPPTPLRYMRHTLRKL